MTSFEPGNLLGRYLDLLLVAERESKERHERTEQTDTDHPPDVPDQRKAGDDGKERVDEADRAVSRHLDRHVLARLSWLILRRARALLRTPIAVSLSDTGQDCKI